MPAGEVSTFLEGPAGEGSVRLAYRLEALPSTLAPLLMPAFVRFFALFSTLTLLSLGCGRSTRMTVPQAEVSYGGTQVTCGNGPFGAEVFDAPEPPEKDPVPAAPGPRRPSVCERVRIGVWLQELSTCIRR